MSSTKSSGKKTFDDFRNSHDKNKIIPDRIRTAIEKLGRDGWEYEQAFIKSAGVCHTDFGRFRNQFEDFIVSIERTKRVWCGSKALAEKMRAVL